LIKNNNFVVSICSIKYKEGMSPRYTIPLILLFLLIVGRSSIANEKGYLSAKPHPGDGIHTLFQRYLIPATDELVATFKERNKGKFTARGGLRVNQSYDLPIKVYKFNGKTIRSTINIYDYTYAKSIEDYNRQLWKMGTRKMDFKDDMQLWVPEFDVTKAGKGKTKISKPKFVIEKLFGNEYQKVKIEDRKLEGHVYYLISGHGGPDPGAMGEINGNSVCEDEYAYDVTLRTARNLLSHGAKVYIIVTDTTDGIRDEKFLRCDRSEDYLTRDTISHVQLTRLQKRAEIVNKLFRENALTAKSQKAIVFHVDSRFPDKEIDIFFYYNPGSEKGMYLANTLFDTIQKKYKEAQPGRGYRGTVTERNLFMLRETLPVCVYIELGNIQNWRDQKRIIEINNRQAMANWLTDGLIKYSKKW
jgi:N-acetylmuramoyl-L-alanine amidase